MATQQPILFRTINASSTSATEYIPINTRGQAWGGTLSSSELLIPTAGKSVELNIKIDTAPGAAASGKKYTFTLMVNGSPSTTLTGDILETATTLTVTADQALAAGDVVALRVVPTSTPASFGRIDGNVIWQPTVDDEYIFLSGHPLTVLHATATEWVPLSGGGQGWGSSRDKRAQPMPAAGTIKKLAVLVNGSPGVGKTYTMRVDKDGTGSTETVVIDDGDENTAQINTNDFWTVTAGENYAFSCTPSGTPTVVTGLCSCVFVPTTTGQIPLLGGSGDNAMNTAATEYGAIGEQENLSGTRASHQVELVNIEMVFKSVYLKQNSTTGGSGYTFNFEIDAVDQASLQATIDGTSTAGNTTGASVTVSSGESINIEMVPSSPTSARTLQHGYMFTFAGGAEGPTFVPRAMWY